MDGWDGMGGKGMLRTIHHRKVKNGEIFIIGKGMLGNIYHMKGKVGEYSP